MEKEITILTGLSAAFKKSPAGILIGLLVLYAVFATTNWQNAEAGWRKAKDDLVLQEQAHSNEKALFMKQQNEQWFELGQLRARAELKMIEK